VGQRISESKEITNSNNEEYGPEEPILGATYCRNDRIQYYSSHPLYNLHQMRDNVIYGIPKHADVHPENYIY